MLHLCILLVLLLATGGQCAGQTVTLHGTCDGCREEWAYLLYTQSNGQETFDSAAVTNGKFTFSLQVQEPVFTQLLFSESKLSTTLYLDTTHVYVYVDTTTRMGSIVNGGTTNGDARQLKQLLAQNHNEIRAWQMQYYAMLNTADSTRLHEIDKAWLNAIAEREQLKKTWITEHPHSYVSAQTIYHEFSDKQTYPAGDSLLSMLHPTLQNSLPIRLRKQKINTLQLLQPGKPMLHFAQPDTAGRSISTQQFAGRYLLIDFWASWCKPCRDENPNLIKAYKRYHSKGFDIVGVSLDSNRESWISAIVKDGLEWLQVADLKGINNAAAKLYALNAIPDNFLISPEGNIIARELRGAQLEEKLHELLDK